MISVILCAAGSGKRAGLPENKILFELDGLPVLVRTLSAFAPYADELLVACREEDRERIEKLLTPFPKARTVVGGETRAESVFRALEEATSDMVLVHDADRPFVTPKIIADCIDSIKKFGSGVCALPATDTTVLASEGKILQGLPRETVYTLQTPQGFYTEELRSAYRKAAEEGLGKYTDDSGVYASQVGASHLFLGDRSNRKLTYPEDFSPAERVGFGVDTHAFAHQEERDRGIARLNLSYIKLGGVVIPSDRELSAHSDGDVVCHALMDALLSAAGKRDIGFYFPDTDPRYEGADSMDLLAEVMKMVHGGGFSVKNASIAILAERPRLSPYLDEMRMRLGKALGCEAAVAAGTNEKLGYIGEGRGITVCAYVLLGTLK